MKMLNASGIKTGRRNVIMLETFNGRLDAFNV